jgi:outer membrane protein
MSFRSTSVVAICCLLGFVRVSSAQSTEMDRPTPVTSIDTSARFDRPLVHYYSFEAGPGEFTLLTAALLTDGGVFAAGNIWFRVLDGNLREIESINLSLGNTEEQKLNRYTLAQRSTVVLKIEVGTFAFSKGGRYRFRLGGIIHVTDDRPNVVLRSAPTPETASAATLPRSIQPAPAPAVSAVPPAPAAASVEVPFPAGAKSAFVNIQRIAAESAQGKSLNARVQALNNQKLTDLNEKNRALQAAQQKLESGSSALSVGARGQLEKDIARQQTEIQRFTDDAKKEVQDLQTALQSEFQQKLGPVVQQVAQEKKLDILFSALDAGIIWANAGLDLTNEVIRKFDAAAPKK